MCPVAQTWGQSDATAWVGGGASNISHLDSSVRGRHSIALSILGIIDYLSSSSFEDYHFQVGYWRQAESQCPLPVFHIS